MSRSNYGQQRHIETEYPLTLQVDLRQDPRGIIVGDICKETSNLCRNSSLH